MSQNRTRHASGDHIISIVPIEVCLDHRLTLTQIRVLVALFSFRNKDTGVAKVKRSTLSERCGYPETRISTTTSELVSLGWIEKEGKGGFSQPSSYRVTTPDLATITESVTVNGDVTVTRPVTVLRAVTVTEPVTITQSVTVTEPVTTTVTELVTPTVTEPVTRIKGIEQSNELSTVQSKDTPLPPRGDVAGFDKFWSSYPKKTAKEDARKAFAKLRPDESLLETMLSSLESAKRSRDWAKDDGRYIPHASTWLNGRRWEDDIVVPAYKSASAAGPSWLAGGI